MKPWKLQEMTLEEVSARRWRVAVLPIGACEPHGPHLPYGTDAFQAEGIADRVCAAAAAQGADVLVLPTIGYGAEANLMRFPLAIDVTQETLNRLVLDVLRTLEQHGVEKLVIFNSHGGNDFKPLVRGLYGRTPLFVCIVEWWKTFADVQGEILDVTAGDHANEMEASIILALRPELVHLDRAGDGHMPKTRFEAMNRGWVGFSRPWHLATRDSTAGDPRQATAEKGERLLSVVVDRIGRFLAELSAAEMDERFPY